MYLDTSIKKCDCCGLYLDSKDFFKNKSKSDGLQNRCKDCMHDYKIKLKQGLIEKQEIIKNEFYYIPNIYIIGIGRMQTYQHSCLNCEDAFFCLQPIKQLLDLFCESCDLDESKVPEKNISKINFIGNVIGWKVKVEDPTKKRIHRNYKKCYVRDRYTCQYCGYNLENAKEFIPLHVDHIRPWSSQGGNSLSNLCVACSDCNHIVSDKWFSTFEEKKEFIIFEKQKKKMFKERAQRRLDAITPGKL
jgi:5-methylcytosine-specific restriction endonuclease McrA